jgi:hypothetical protein
VCKDFVLYYGGVVPDKNIFYSEGRDLGDEDATKCICNGSVDTDERKGAIKLFIVVELDRKG